MGLDIAFIVKTVCHSATLIENCARDGSKEFFTTMHCILIRNPLCFFWNSIKERNASW